MTPGCPGVSVSLVNTRAFFELRARERERVREGGWRQVAWLGIDP